MAANPQTPPSGHPHCEDPPVLPSVKGTPFTDGRTGGRPPGDGFYRSRAWLFSIQDSGRAGAGQAPPFQKPPLGKRDPPLRYQVGFTGSLGCCPRNGSPPCHPEDRAFSRGPPLAASPLGPQRQSARGSPGDLGPGPGSSQGSEPGGAGLGGRDPLPRTGSAVGSQACAQLRPLRVLLWPKLPHTAPRRQTWTRGFHSLKSVLPT